MEIGPYISRRFGKIFIVWIQNANQWIQFEEPAFFVFERLAKGEKEPIAVRHFTERYSIGEKETEKFVKDIQLKLSGLETMPGLKESSRLKTGKEDIKGQGAVYKHRCYEANGKRIRINYGSELFEYYIHHSFGHLENNISAPDFIFSIVEEDGIITLSQEIPAGRTWHMPDIPTLKRRVFIEVGNALHGKSDHDWMSIIHGAAVRKGQEALIFSSSTGSGKSTLTALLLKNGFELVSDDYIPVDSESGKIFPFPAALSIKSGSIPILDPLYPGLKKEPERNFRLTNKSLRYIFPVELEKFSYEPVSAKYLIFTEFIPDSGFSLMELDVPRAFSIFNQEAWISPEPVHTSRVLDWFSGLKFFKLRYGADVDVVAKLKEELPGALS